MMIRLETLHKIAEDRPGEKLILFEGPCRRCGCDVEVMIHIVGPGFGMLGGVLYEDGSDEILVTCKKCNEKHPAG